MNPPAETGLDDIMPFDPEVPPQATPHSSGPPSLQTLPTELQQQIYGNIFTNHKYTSRCTFPYKDYVHAGCRCGKGLSLTSRFFYEETRHLFYKYAMFAFKTPLACTRFLNGIGSLVEHVGSLSITFKYGETELLRRIFNRSSLVSSLHTLHLRYTSEAVLSHDTQGWTALPGQPSFPIYLPSARKRDPNIEYDIQYRPEGHPLSRLTSLHKLIVEGHVESEEIQEAVVKLCFEIADSARKEGIEIEDTEIIDCSRNPTRIFYIIQRDRGIF